jgi:hypothetical protein
MWKASEGLGGTSRKSLGSGPKYSLHADYQISPARPGRQQAQIRGQGRDTSFWIGPGSRGEARLASWPRSSREQPKPQAHQFNEVHGQAVKRPVPPRNCARTIDSQQAWRILDRWWAKDFSCSGKGQARNCPQAGSSRGPAPHRRRERERQAFVSEEYGYSRSNLRGRPPRPS